MKKTEGPEGVVTKTTLEESEDRGEEGGPDFRSPPTTPF